MARSNSRSSSPPQSFTQLYITEPFRVFFPLGMLLGIVGVALWPLYETGLSKTYPLEAHIRLMSYGFLGSFVIGFLLTAGPRLLSCPQPPKSIIQGQLALTLIISITSVVSPSIADACFLLQSLSLLALSALGFTRRKDLPPPGFLLGITGILCAALGSYFLLQISLGKGGSNSYPLSRILLFQAFPALPLVGIGAFFFPKLTGSANPHNLPENPSPSLPWLKRAVWSVATASLFLATIPLELKGQASLAYGLRAVSLALYIFIETPVFKQLRNANSQHRSLVLCCFSLLASFTLVAIFPAYRVAALHLFFIAGLTGAILLVSTRVIFGHSGNFQLAKRSGRPLLISLALLCAAGTIRLLADFTLQIRTYELIAASLLWLVVSFFWLRYVAPKSTVPDPDDTAC